MYTGPRKVDLLLRERGRQEGRRRLEVRRGRSARRRRTRRGRRRRVRLVRLVRAAEVPPLSPRVAAAGDAHLQPVQRGSLGAPARRAQQQRRKQEQQRHRRRRCRCRRRRHHHCGVLQKNGRKTPHRHFCLIDVSDDMDLWLFY